MTILSVDIISVARNFCKTEFKMNLKTGATSRLETSPLVGLGMGWYC